MKEKLYTIPVNDAVNANDECPICNAEQSLENDAIEYAIGPGASYMESDIREMTDKAGFCRRHFNMMYKYGNSLGNALILTSHVHKVSEDIKKEMKNYRGAKGGLFSKGGTSNVEEYINSLTGKCFVCDYYRDTYKRYIATFFHLYENDTEFREKIKNGKGFCLPHMGELLHEAPGYLKGKLDFDKLSNLYLQRMKLTRLRTLFRETFFSFDDEITSRAWRSNWGMKVEGPKDKPQKQYFTFDDNSKEWDEATDCELLATLIRNYRLQVDSDYLPDFYQTIDKQFHGDYAAYVKALYKKSVLMKSGKPIYFNKKNYNKDLGVQYGLSISEIMAKITADRRQMSYDIAEQEKLLCDAVLRMEMDMPNYSDANFTMRMTYGQIGEYTLGGRPSGYYTTARSLWEKMQKADDNFEYFAEPVMHELMSQKDFGKYADKLTGTMQLCFLSNNDITGGNSGSPIFNGKGELLGLAFDGNWDSLASDIFFDRQLARTINVDVRFMLFMMDRWGHADRLLQEINAK